MFRIMIIEDDATLAELLVEELEAEGYEARSWPSAEEALESLAGFDPDLLVTDLQLPGADGFAVLEHVRELDHPPGVVMITAYGTIDRAVAALKAGADNFLTKPLDMDHLIVSVQRVLDYRNLQTEVERFRASMGAGDFHRMQGSSRPMRSLFDHIGRVAQAQGAVLITGESGTGKELAARAVHAESERAEGPFLAVNCAGVPEGLLESEFFGHSAGAFSGANRERKGLFREAHGGTLFLDEIADMPSSLQAKLLRALEDGTVRPLGAEREHRVDVRLVAATNQDLGELVEARRFRKDLYYRLEAFHLLIPPLRERDDDPEILATTFLARFATARHRPARRLSTRAIEAIRTYHWPGNVRELQNAIERAVTFCEGETVDVEHLPERIRKSRGQAFNAPGHALLRLADKDGQLATIDEMRHQYVQYVLDRVNGNKRRAASVLGVSRRTLYRWLDD